MPTNFIKKYQTIRNEAEVFSKYLQTKSSNNTEGYEQYQHGQLLYQNCKALDAELQKNLSSLSYRLKQAQKQANKQGQRQKFKKNFKDFLDQAPEVLKQSIKASGYSADQNRYIQCGIISAFYQDILSQLKDTEEPKTALNCLENVQQHLKDIDSHYDSSILALEYNILLCSIERNKEEDILNKSLTNPGLRDIFFGLTIPRLDHLLSEGIYINTASVNNVISQYGFNLLNFNDDANFPEFFDSYKDEENSFTFDDFLHFDVFLDNIMELRQNMLDTPDITNVHPSPVPDPTPIPTPTPAPTSASAPGHNTSATVTPPQVNGTTPSHSGAPQ